ncbi:alcohol dehydrogenase [Affinibrenneria salicis]|uniref:Alcohol dehydrogenase n=1 Tax=Affinibrenneria salicis TaxID=2590031 RepID=A0A5J5FT97_9GAMM|nr:zinc-binding dehydrogenase [Affinibrenneria salicis]KAA8996671.1 alcohol dehydrogenase [Affinibrenneria salicis]
MCDENVQNFEALPADYRAWRWRNSAEPQDLALESIPMAPPAPGQALVRNQVIGLNPVDWKVLGGALVDWRGGKVPGVDGAGIVVAVGDGVASEWLGQRVAYHQNLQQPGSFAEYTPIVARALLRVPDGMDVSVAASFPCPGLTAWLALEKVPPQPGSPVLISGAGGAVGHYLVQLAAARGFSVTTLSHARHWARLQALGASECLAGPLAADQRWPQDDARFYAVIDSVNERHAAQLAPALLANGHLVCIQGRLEQWPCAPFGRALSLHEVALGALHRFGDDASWSRLTAAGERLLSEIAGQRLQPEAQVVREFSELARLLDDLRHRQFSGKPLVRL